MHLQPVEHPLLQPLLSELEPALPLVGLIQEHIFAGAKRAAPLMACANLWGRSGLRTVVIEASIRR
jgi:hypothetical protein